MIKIENISKVFNPHSRNRNEVLKGVSFELPEKGLVAIFGKSGSGKTTLLNILGGLEKQDGGKVFIDGENVAGKVDKIRNAKIGFIFQNYYLEKGYTIAEIMRNAMLIAGFKDEEEIKRRCEEVLTLVDMERYKNKQGDALSGGQKQRVAIARALIKGADVILADEPTGNLDAQNTVKVMEILKEISKTKLVVLVTHELTLIKNYADSYIEIVDGQIVKDSKLGDAIAYNTEVNNIYVDETSARELSDGKLSIELYGEPVSVKDAIQIINDNGSLYIKAGKNVTVLDDSSEKRIVFGERKREEITGGKRVPNFTKSVAKRNGKLFTLKSIFRLFRGNKEERFYSTANIFKQVFICAIAVVMCFFSFSLFELYNTTVENKNISATSVYTNLNTYQDIRAMDSELYKKIGFFETREREGNFSYGSVSALSSLKADYTPKAIETEDTSESLGIQYGKMPGEDEILISRALAEDLKTEIRLPELQKDRSMLLVKFEGTYRVSGIVSGNEPAVYLNKSDYVNFLQVFDSTVFEDTNEVFFDEAHSAVTFSTEIREADQSLNGNDRVIVEINRNSLYKMMDDTQQAFGKAESANAAIDKKKNSVKIENSNLYVQKFEISKNTAMSSDIILYVSDAVLDDIFVYLSPNLDALESVSSSDDGYYFEIETEGGTQLSDLKAELTVRGITPVNIQRIYERENTTIMQEAMSGLNIFYVVIVLLLLIYYFIEKSGSIKNSKEYGIYRAIGVNRSNLLFKEAITTCRNNLIGYLLFYLIVTLLMSVRYAIMNVTFGMFIGIAAGIFAVSALLLVGISLIPYLFVTYQTPSKILAKYDI